MVKAIPSGVRSVSRWPEFSAKDIIIPYHPSQWVIWGSRARKYMMCL
jgi:hypothetical protein